MLKLSFGKISLERKIIDLKEFEVRDKVTDADLEGYYDSFMDHVGKIRDYFENQNAFYEAAAVASNEKRPKLISREPKSPPIFSTYWKNVFEFDPTKKRFDDRYFTGPHCIIMIPTSEGQALSNSSDSHKKLSNDDIYKKFQQHSGYEGIIEINNDYNRPNAKASLFHEALHYLIARYHLRTNRNLVDVFLKKDLPESERLIHEGMLNESIVIELTDKLLMHDAEALFESRWSRYAVFGNYRDIRALIAFSSAIPTGILLGLSLIHPYLLPFALVPGRMRDLTLKKIKDSKRDLLTQPRECPIFKI